MSEKNMREINVSVIEKAVEETLTAIKEFISH